MTTVDNYPAYNAFEQQLKTLCLHEFPCGIGSWKSDHKKKRADIEKDRVNTRFIVTLKDFGADYEKTEALEELIQAKKSPWCQDYSWSDEARNLREIAVQSPWLIDDKFVLSHFKTLRIVDKGVTYVDDEFLKFTHLEELTLSVNRLATVHSANLPRSLKVLELCANQVSQLADLCAKPPALQHLGLGHNSLALVDDYLTAEYWPSLLSLDLSFNNLSDLMDIVRKLQTLPSLRNIILLGNPLALVPGYRGFTIDSIKKLNYLDDISVSADERHLYRGLARRREYILDEAKVTFSVQVLKGVPMPEEMRNPDDQPEFPIVTRKYFIQFMYLEDKSVNAEIFQLIDEDQLTESATHRTDGDIDETATEHSGRTVASQVIGSQQDLEKNVNFAQEVETVDPETLVKPQDEHVPVAGKSCPRPLSEIGEASSIFGEGIPENSDEECNDGKPHEIKLAPVKSTPCPWAEEIEINWSKVVARDELLALRDFFQQGIDVQIMEEKVLSYPAEEESETASQTGGKATEKDKSQDKKDAKGGKDKEKDKKKKGRKTPVKEEKKPADKKKKKGEPEAELVHSPAEYNTLASFHVELRELLEGEKQIEYTFIDEASEARSNSPPASELSKKEAVSKKDKKTKPPSASAGKKKDAKDGKDKGPPRKASIAGGKDGKDKKGGKGGEGGEEDPPPLPPPLEVAIGVRLHHWKTAMDSVKEEEEQTGEGEQPTEGQAA